MRGKDKETEIRRMSLQSSSFNITRAFGRHGRLRFPLLDYLLFLTAGTEMDDHPFSPPPCLTADCFVQLFLYKKADLLYDKQPSAKQETGRLADFIIVQRYICFYTLTLFYLFKANHLVLRRFCLYFDRFFLRSSRVKSTQFMNEQAA